MIVRNIILCVLSAWLLSEVEANAQAFSVSAPNQVYADKPFEIHLRSLQAENLLWRVTWESKTLQSGAALVQPDQDAVLSLIAPKLRAGHILPLELDVTSATGQGPRSLTLWIFPEDPFEDRREWLKSWPVFLYDPQGETQIWFEDRQIPFQSIRDPAKADRGVLVVGEGLSFSTYRNLANSLRVIAASGIPVLCLAPNEGSAYFVDAETGPLPSAWGFQDELGVVELNPKLRGAPWSIAPIGLQAYRGNIQWMFNSKNAGWPWLELNYADGAPLTVLGFRMLPSEKESPAPIYLLDALFTRLHQTHPPRGEKK